jgi:acyl carrier protein
MEEFESGLSELLETDKISANDKLIDFDAWDSLTCLSIIVWAEKRYKIRLSAAEIVDSVTVGGLRNLINDKRNNKGL